LVWPNNNAVKKKPRQQRGKNKRKSASAENNAAMSGDANGPRDMPDSNMPTVKPSINSKLKPNSNSNNNNSNTKSAAAIINKPAFPGAKFHSSGYCIHHPHVQIQERVFDKWHALQKAVANASPPPMTTMGAALE